MLLVEYAELRQGVQKSPVLAQCTEVTIIGIPVLPVATQPVLYLALSLYFYYKEEKLILYYLVWQNAQNSPWPVVKCALLTSVGRVCRTHLLSVECSEPTTELARFSICY